MFLAITIASVFLPVILRPLPPWSLIKLFGNCESDTKIKILIVTLVINQAVLFLKQCEGSSRNNQSFV